MVYLARYLDLFLSFISLYNTVMKVLFITASCATVYLIYVRFKATYDGNHDTFRIELAIIPSLILAFIFHYNMSFLEVGIIVLF
jgi:ER lumen protein retaining receptor